MKHLCYVFLLVFLTSSFCFAQNSGDSFFHINKIPPEGVVLDKGWKFHTGDNPEWAKPEFNDNDWESINPSLDIRHIPQLQQTSYYWFRLKLQVDSSLMGQPLGIILSQIGASEIYLDGKLLYNLGNVDSKNNHISTHYLLNQPLAIKLNTLQTQVLSVRYAYDPKSFLVKLGNPNFCFKAVLNTMPVTLSNYEREYRRSGIYETGIMAVSLLLTIASFCFYFLYPSQKAYKYIGIFGALMFSWRFIGHEIGSMLYKTDLISLTIFISSILVLLSNLFGMNGMYLIFNQKKTRLYYILIFFSLFVTASFILIYDWAGLLFTIYFTLVYIELLRASIKALRNKRPGAIILIYTVWILLISQVAGIASIVYNSLNVSYFVVFFQPVVFAIGWSAFIAYEFARTGLALQARIKEVEELSEEKHRILSEQNVMLEKQVEQRTTSLNKSLQELKSAQAQLIQSEKMASLGELSAGIAHEIQNPLNFVNNFSDVNRELLTELNEEIEKGNLSDVKTIAKNVIENEGKINHHGKRADAIVKGMLQHSRSTSGQKEPTDINALCDEYLRLAYHGLRAKDNSFNAAIKTDFDETIGKINIIPQEIGRVILNLLNNAFYAAALTPPSGPKDSFGGGTGTNHEPTVWVSTKKVGAKVLISVRDNGPGIPQKILDKIFQPFFTTKPTGQGTGLGLSLAYDIVKAHGGGIKVETKEGDGSEFIIQLPI